MANLKLLIFDFDGTIADTLDTIISLINEKGPDYGLKIFIDKKELKRLQGRTPIQVMKEFSIPIFKLPFFVTKIRGELLKRMDQVPVIKNIEKVLTHAKKKGLSLCIVTSNSKENVESFLKSHAIAYFDDVYSNKNIFQKAATLKKIMREKNFNRDEVIYIGDEVRDIEACKKAGIRIVSVSWGFNNEEILAKFQPDWLVNTPEELIGVIDSFD